uniref:C2H2-type domain-containing protein n=1 Tax=Panagrolaimus sp. JU765 TaxID=591449 RepID=A0AC34QSM2_9BILA
MYYVYYAPNPPTAFVEPPLINSAENYNGNASGSEEKVVKCDYCPKKYNLSQIENHRNECRSIRCHECPQCGKRFKARGGLQQHSRIHLQERSYGCRFCPKRFTQKSHLDQHERIHTGLKPFQCQFCGRSFRQRSQQIGHEATHPQGKCLYSRAEDVASSVLDVLWTTVG